MKLLGPEEVAMKHQKLALEWALVSGTQLELTQKFEDFAQALAFVNQVGEIAEKLNHHPDIHLSYGKVDVSISTHSAGGLTNKDFEFAEAIKA